MVIQESKTGVPIFHSSQKRCILFLLCLDRYLPTRTAVRNVEINQMFKIIKNTFLSAFGKERCGMEGLILKWTYRQWFYSSVPLSIPIKMNLKVSFSLFAIVPYQRNDYRHLISNEMHIKKFCFVVLFLFCFPSVAAL